jgi:hypothetical protein
MDAYLEMQQRVAGASDVASSTVDGDPRTLEMKQTVKKWTELDSALRRLNVQIQDIKLEKKSLEGKIIEYMRVNDIEGLNTKYCLIKCKTVKSKTKTPNNVIEEKLKAAIPDETTRQVVKDLLKSRAGGPVVEKVQLKRMAY